MRAAHEDITAVLFDVGGVLVTSRPSPATVAAILGLDPGTVDAVEMVDKAMWFHRDTYDAGSTDREFWDSVAGDCGLAELSDETVRELVHEDVSRSEFPDSDALDIARELHDRGLVLGILSNAPTPIARAIPRWSWASIFTSFTFSGPLGVCKPERRIYRQALADVGRPAGEVLFVDDRQPNLRAAELMGMSTLEWVDARRARSELTEAGLLGAVTVH